MDFDDTPEEAKFRATARAWLDAERPDDLLRDLAAVEDSGDSAERTAGALRASKAWQQRKFAGGWACLSWPKAFGGRAATPIERVIWDQEESPYAALSSIFQIGHGMCGPTLMAFASDAQKQRFLPPMASGEEIWCQLFSEPAAGSDLAGLRTRAVRADDDWIVNGQKVWTTGAHFSDYGILIVRTDPEVAKHKGLTMFFVDMRSPGVEVRPIRQASGRSGFNEVYFTDVRIPDAQRLGKVGDGWNVSLTTLMNERLTIGSSIATGAPEYFELACNARLADGTLAINDPEVRSRLASWTARANGLKYTSYRAISALSRGERPGPENSIGKLVAAPMMQEIATAALDLQGPAGALARSDKSAAGRLHQMLYNAAGIRIAGGSDEIMRNIIAERVLGLPPDIRVDKDVPFREIPTKGR
jgi:alkylation response protein AidB-like acyl-CoA dehydrogenase